MNNKTIKTMLLVLTVSFTGASYAATATPHAQNASEDCSMGMGMSMGKMGMGMGHMAMGNMSMNFSQLNLTDQQKQEIQAIMAASMNGNHQNMTDMQMHHTDMQALLSSDVFDENKAKALIANHQSQMGERKLTMLKMKHQIFQLLDDEQREQLMSMQNTRMNTKEHNH
jgi:Spy/CpxP family protein refolding chaperone